MFWGCLRKRQPRFAALGVSCPPEATPPPFACHCAHALAPAATPLSFACHCEERSDGTIRSPRSKAKRKAILWANPKSVTNSPGATSLPCGHLPCFSMSLRGAERRGNPHPLRQGKTKSNYSRRIRSYYEFALRIANLQSFSAGTRIATPVCALVRNDMLKEEACARLQGRLVRKVRRNLPGVSGCKGFPPTVIARSGATGQSASLRQSMTGSSTLGESEKRDKFAWRHVVALRTPAMFQHVIARSGATWQSVLLAVKQNEKQYFGRIREAPQICPKNCQFAKFLCGDADCRTSVRTGSQ